MRSLRGRPKEGDTGGLELRKQIWILTYKLDMIFVEQESPLASGGAEAQEEEGRPTEARDQASNLNESHEDGRYVKM